MSAAVAGPTSIRPIRSYTTLWDATNAHHIVLDLRRVQTVGRLP